MGIKLNFAFAVAFILHVSAKPLAEKSTCKIVQDYNCGKEKCPCPVAVTKALGWMNFLNAIVQRSFKTCYCDKVCKKIVEVHCKEGKCDQQTKQCKCFPCWTGPTCSRYENKHKPKFTSTFTEINLISNSTVGHTKAFDADASQCQKGLKCPCAKVGYTLVEGGEGTFSIDEESGEIKMESDPFKDDYLLVIGASNNDEQIASKTFVQINTRNYAGRRTLIPHGRARRSVSAGTLVLTIKPLLTTVFYFNIGDQLKFTLSLSHNASVVASAASNVKIRISSEFLALSTAAVTVSKTGAFTTGETMDGDVLELTLSSASFDGGNKYDANITTTVKNTIGPLSNLKLSAELNATSNIHIKETSKPVVHAVYPKVNLTKMATGAVQTYGTKDFVMAVAFPNLNYSLLAELTTNIEDFVCMELQGVTVQNKGANVNYNGTATPKYYSTNNDGKNDRVVIDFGFLRNTADTGNTIEIAFTVKVLDHILLVNNTKHWIGVGLQAGLRVLWVEQQSFTILKKEPSLELQITATNFTNLTRLYFGDNLPITYTIKHTNTSTDTAKNIKLSCVFDNLVLPESEVTAGKASRLNDTSLVAKPNSLEINSLSLGNTLQGVFNLQLPLTVTPFVETKVKCFVNYTNNGNIFKDLLSKELTPTVLAGTPAIILSANGTDNQMTPGETRTFTVKVLLSKMRSPIRFELVMPMISNQSVFHISSVGKAVIGANVQGLNESAEPVLISTQKDGINNAAIYDLGIGTNTNSSSANPVADTISLTFNVILLDHNNVTNGSSHWVGAGLVGKPKMIWVGQISMTAIVPVDSRPWLYMKPSIIPLADSKQYPDYQYNIILKHKPISNQRAFDVKIRFFLPDYVIFVSMVSGADARFTEKQFGGSRFFEMVNPINFQDSFNFTFKVQIDPTKFPHDGKVFITTPIYLLYKNRVGQHFTLVKLLRKSVTVPDASTIPTVNGVAEHFEKGISWHVNTATNTYSLYICSNDKAKRLLSACFVSTDRGATWRAIDSRVSSILGHNAAGNVFGIGKNKRSYMMFDLTVNKWVSVPKSMFNPPVNQFVKLEDSHVSGVPASNKIIGLDHWGVSKDGVFMKQDGAGAWKQKSIWL